MRLTCTVSPALNKSLAPPLGLYSADAISRELMVEKKYSALAVGELREKKEGISTYDAI
jgi:hypothetical protein